MLSFADVFDLFTHKLTRLSTRCFTFSFITTCSFNRLFFWHCYFPFSQAFLHEIKTESRLCVPLVHSNVDSFMQLSKTHTDVVRESQRSREGHGFQRFVVYLRARFNFKIAIVGEPF